MNNPSELQLIVLFYRIRLFFFSLSTLFVLRSSRRLPFYVVKIINIIELLTIIIVIIIVCCMYSRLEKFYRIKRWISVRNRRVIKNAISR